MMSTSLLLHSAAYSLDDVCRPSAFILQEVVLRQFDVLRHILLGLIFVHDERTDGRTDRNFFEMTG